MAVTQTTVTGPIYTPNISKPDNAQIVFELTSWDREEGEATFVTGPYVGAIDSNGDFSVDLFTTTEGTNMAVYHVSVMYVDALGKYTRDSLGTIALAGPGPYNLADLDFIDPSTVASFDILAEIRAYAEQLGIDVATVNEGITQVLQIGEVTSTLNDTLQASLQGAANSATEAGEARDAILDLTVNANTVASNQTADASYSATTGELNLSIPRGVDGVDGQDGQDGQDGAQGPQGDVGPVGPQGPSGVSTSPTAETLETELVTNLDTLGGTKAFRFIASAVGAPDRTINYDAVGWQIASTAHTSQFISIGNSPGDRLSMRIDDGNGVYSDWHALDSEDTGVTDYNDLENVPTTFTPATHTHEVLETTVAQNLDTLTGSRSFSFSHNAVGAPERTFNYDAVGWQIDTAGQVSQFVSIGSGIGDGLIIRSNDGGGFGPWTSLDGTGGGTTSSTTSNIEFLNIGNEIRFAGGTGNRALIQKNSVAIRDELQIYGNGDAFSTGSRGAGMHLYGNRDAEHHGNFAFMTGQDDQGDARMIIKGGHDPATATEALSWTGNDTRITIGNGIFNFVDNNQDIGMLTLKDAVDRPALYITGTGTRGDITVPTGQTLEFGQTASSGAFTKHMELNASGTFILGGTNVPDVFPANNASGYGMTFLSTAQERGRLCILSDAESGLNIGRHTSTGNIAQFYYNGSLRGSIGITATATAYNTTSDHRLKEDYKPVEDSVTKVLALQPRNFKWKDDGTRSDGFIAHELEEVYPDVVTGDKDAVGKSGDPHYQVVDHSKLVPLLTSALQDALIRIEKLEAAAKPKKGKS